MTVLAAGSGHHSGITKTPQAAARLLVLLPFPLSVCNSSSKIDSKKRQRAFFSAKADAKVQRIPEIKKFFDTFFY